MTGHPGNQREGEIFEVDYFHPALPISNKEIWCCLFNEIFRGLMVCGFRMG